MDLTPAQQEALDDARRFAKHCRGRVQVGMYPVEHDGDVGFDLTIAIGDLRPGSISEPVKVVVPAGFPFKKPVAFAQHLEFAGLPHVQWGNQLCLYASAADWDAALGMWGFLQRLVEFYGRLADDTLDGPEMPWHPPVAYVDDDAPVVVVQEDVPRDLRRSLRPSVRWAIAWRRSPRRVDVVGWLQGDGLEPDPERPDWVERVTRRMEQIRSDNPDETVLLVPCIQLPGPLSFEYPRYAGDLVHACAGTGISITGIAHALALGAMQNDTTSRKEGGGDVFFLIRAKGRRRAGNSPWPAHFAAWQLSLTSATNIARMATFDVVDEREFDELDREFSGARIRWAIVYDDRSDVVRRRDHERPAARLRDRRVLILGCGALGRPIAEHCVRAGAAVVTVVDKARVTPGLLVRQGYRNQDVGVHKAEALTAYLMSIRDDVEIQKATVDAATDQKDIPTFLTTHDVIIDATADRAVAARLELAHREPEVRKATTISVGVDVTASMGLATVSPPDATGAGTDLLRQFLIATAEGDELDDVYHLFFDGAGEDLRIEPEPGCSSPTFVGSHSDVTGLAAHMLNAALSGLEQTVFAVTQTGEASREPQTGSVCVIRTGTDGSAVTRIVFPQPTVVRDVSRRGYEVRMHPSAVAGIERAMAIVPPSSLLAETGGLLLGQFDDASRVVWISEITGPPPGSEGWPFGFELNTPEGLEEVDKRTAATRGAVRLIGYWHTHPNGSCTPSAKDLQTMRTVESRQRLMLIIGGVGRMTPERIHAEVFFAADHADPDGVR